MAKPFHSASWYRVAALKPRLRSHIRLHRQVYRGRLWYVLDDPVHQRYHRFSPAAYCLIGAMDGKRTVENLWEHAEAILGDDAPAQDEIIELLGQLYFADALQCDVPPDIAGALANRQALDRRRWHTRLLNPLSWQFFIFDPERMLEYLLPALNRVFSRLGAILWSVVVFSALFVSAMHWQDLTQDITDRILTPQNLILLWLLFPLVKLFHEFGHAAAVKVCGGEVHDLGIMFLMLQPVPYVDASSAWAFPDKWQRILVGAGGMLAELFFAALAVFVWLSVEPGAVRAVAYNIIFISGVTTVLFNANPLLRYDGYYMLTDYLEMPNLRTRANGYLRYLVERYLIGCRDEAAETFSVTERIWFTAYPVASFIYRIFVVAAIALFLAGKFLLLGVVVALSGLFGSVLMPLAKGGVELYNLTRRAGARGRAIAARAAAVACLMVAAVWLPLPLRTHAEGVVWIPDDSYVRASVDGFIQRVVAQPGTWVHRGDLLVVCEDAQAEKEVKVLEFRLDELKTRYAAQWLEDIKQAQIIKDEIAHVEQRLARARERLTDLTIRARADGVFILPDAQNLAGRLIQQGGRLGYVLDFSTLTARVIVTQVDVDLVRARTRGVEARLAERPSERLAAVVKREVPAASEELPSTALGSQGGGAQAVDPVDRRGVKAIEKLFQLELGLPSAGKLVNVGGRIYVRFDHGWEPLVFRYVRRLQQLFLTKIYA